MIEKAIAESIAAEKFHEELINLCTTALQVCGCQPISLSAVVAQGGVPAAKNYLASNKVQSRLSPLSEYGRKDLSVESLVIRREYRGLFEPNEIWEAKRRLNL